MSDGQGPKLFKLLLLFFNCIILMHTSGMSCACTITIFEVHISGANIILNYTSQSLSNVSLIHVQWQERKKNTKIHWQQCLVCTLEGSHLMFGDQLSPKEITVLHKRSFINGQYLQY